MRVLIVKTSSMGDVLHTLPALTDAAQAIPGIRFDWVDPPLAQSLVLRADQSRASSLSRGRSGGKV